MYTVGLTGGIGSGKSTIATMFNQLDIFSVDLDDVARWVVAPNQPVLKTLHDYFKNTVPDILLANGELNRAALRQHIFTHPEAKKWLEARLHPLIRTTAQHHIQAATSPYALLISPLLFEAQALKVRQLVNASIVVDVPETTQIARASLRDGNTPAQIERIMAGQCSRSDRLKQATYVIDNNSTLEYSREQVEHVHKTILATLASKT
ncbi:MAG: dephospho-CoA kinase [Marinagarivorans sp.]|nr:dephospho-CoA kinase [Marinagarivorans sp.]